jgi:hypothetical protein
MTQVTRKMCKKRTNANNAYRSQMDYSAKGQYAILEIVTDTKVSATTIKQILKTAHLGQGTHKACLHELAQIEDVFNALNRIKKGKYFSTYAQEYNAVLDDLFSVKREQIDIYLKKVYKIDVTSMPASHIREMLDLTSITQLRINF